ncbi:MAG: hypothetical protein BJ554DRAFT_2134, partial [Olpidium bornovanus]
LSSTQREVAQARGSESAQGARAGLRRGPPRAGRDGPARADRPPSSGAPRRRLGTAARLFCFRCGSGRDRPGYFIPGRGEIQL